jgi:hypothetical protein
METKMKHVARNIIWASLALLYSFGNLALAQSQNLSSAIGVSVFPADGQDSTQQSKDEAECYSWAEDNSGVDPFALEKQQHEQDQQTEEQLAAAQQAQGGGGVVKGAAAGAIVGELAGNDVGHSAAVGAAIGGVANRRRNKKAQQQEAQIEQQAASSQQATAAQIDKFMNGFTACLEAKDYVAKY